MREIKFRCWGRFGEWNEEEQENDFTMIDAHDLAFDDYKPLWEQLRDIEGHQYFMQSTGLQDKNGKDIYEGDILQRFKKSGEAYKKTKVVEWVRSGFSNLNQLDEHEIIGNIHQDSHLLSDN